MNKTDQPNNKIKVTDEDIKNAENIVEAVGLFAKLFNILKGIFSKK